MKCEKKNTIVSAVTFFHCINWWDECSGKEKDEAKVIEKSKNYFGKRAVIHIMEKQKNQLLP